MIVPKGFKKLEWIGISLTVGRHEGCWLLIPSQSEISFALLEDYSKEMAKNLMERHEIWKRFLVKDPEKYPGKYAQIRVEVAPPDYEPWPKNELTQQEKP